MTQEEKLEKVTMWLAINHIRHRIHIKGVDEKLAPYMRIVTREKRVALCVCPPDAEEGVFNEARKLGMHPVFVREHENVFFIIEKVKNALKGWSTKVAKEQEKKAKTAAKIEHKRIRIAPKVEKVNPNRVRAEYDVHCADMAEKENQAPRRRKRIL